MNLSLDFAAMEVEVYNGSVYKQHFYANISEQKVAGGCHSRTDSAHSTVPRTAPALHPAAPRTKPQKAAQLCGISRTSCCLSLAQLKLLTLFTRRIAKRRQCAVVAGFWVRINSVCVRHASNLSVNLHQHQISVLFRLKTELETFNLFYPRYLNVPL